MSTKLYAKCCNQVATQAVTFLVNLQKIKKMGHFEIFLNSGPKGSSWKFQNTTSPTVLILSSQTLSCLWEHWLQWGNTLLLLFLAIRHVLQNLWHFEILTRESMGISSNMLHISKMADHREKRMKIGTCGPRNSYIHVYIYIYMCVRYISCLIPWVQFGIIQCTLQNFRHQDFQKAAPTVFIHFQPNFMDSMLIRGDYRLLHFWRSSKKKKYGSLKVLLIQDQEVGKGWKFENVTPTVFIWS